MFVSWSIYNPSLEEFMTEKGLRKLLYLYGRDFCFNKFLIISALNKTEPENFAEIIERINTLEIPVFQVKGKNIIDAGIMNNHRISDVLRQLENAWIDSDFTLTFNELMCQAKGIISETDKAG